MPASADTATATLAFLASLEAEASRDQAAASTREAYRSAQQNRLNRDWMPSLMSGDAAIGESWPLTTARIRDQVRNEPILKKAVSALTKHIVGTGISSFADVLLSTEDLHDDFNFEADELFQEWAEDECDVEGRHSFSDMQSLAFRECITVGEVILLRCALPDSNRLTPLCYQLLEAEQIDETKHQLAGPGQNAIVRGIEYDLHARPVAYWLHLDHPYDYFQRTSANSVRVPADRVIHLFFPGRPSEGRGISWFSALMQTARDSDHLVGNELTASAIAALLTVLYKRGNGGTSQGTGFGGQEGETIDDRYNPGFKLGKGTVSEVTDVDDIKVIQSERPGPNIPGFVKFLLQLGSMGADLSYLRLTSDYSQSSYTSARGAHLDDDATFRPIQHWLARALVKPIRRAVQRQFAALGRYRSVSTGLFFAQQRRFQRLHLQPPGRDQLDPAGETTASADRVRYLFSDWDSECGARGKNFRRLVLKQKQQRAFAARHGVPLDLSPNPQLPPPETTEEEQPAAIADDDTDNDTEE
ncbi:MAG: phage portal protein [Pirellulales bacterium]